MSVALCLGKGGGVNAGPNWSICLNPDTSQKLKNGVHCNPLL